MSTKVRLIKNTVIALSTILFVGCTGHIAKDLAIWDVKNDEPNFLVWYDGWGVYTIWGIGLTNSAFVTCGKEDIYFYTTFDTHTRFFEETYPDRKYPKDKFFAINYNLELLKYFKYAGKECNFSEVLVDNKHSLEGTR